MNTKQIKPAQKILKGTIQYTDNYQEYWDSLPDLIIYDSEHPKGKLYTRKARNENQ